MLNKKTAGLLLTFVMLLSWGANGQSPDPYTKWLISRNIISYHLRYGRSSEGDLKVTDGLCSDDKFSMNNLSPSDTNRLDITISPADLTYPNPDYTLYKIYKRRFDMGNDSIRSIQSTTLKADDHYLVGYNKKNGRLKFLSGNFFKSIFYLDFQLDATRPESFYEYLRIKMYNYQFDDIRHEHSDQGNLAFRVFSRAMNHEIILEVDKNDFDVVTISPR